MIRKFLTRIMGSTADRALKDPADHDRLLGAMEQLSTWLARATEEGLAALQALHVSATETNDLADAFRRAIEECRLDSTTDITLSVKGSAREMHPGVRDEIYRVGYEAIRNACVHSHASRINVALDYGDDLALRITDNGVGIAAAVIETGKEGHVGLRGMRERSERIGATFTFVSSPGTGTSITLTVAGRTAFQPASGRHEGVADTFVE